MAKKQKTKADPDLVLNAWEQLKSDRNPYEGTWQEVADLVRPEVFFNGERTPGTVSRLQIFDDTAPNAADELASQLDGMLTNTSIRWFGFVPLDPSVEPDDELDMWLYQVTSAVLRAFEDSECNWMAASHECYLELVTFGTGVVSFDDLMGAPLVTFQSQSLANVWLDQNSKGEVNHVCRQFKMTVAEILQTFPMAANNGEIVKMMQEKSRQKLDLLHSVYERYDYDKDSLEPTSKRFASCYVCQKPKCILRESGYDSVPYLTPRWEKFPNEVYGRSPATRVLPTIKGVNVVSRTELEAVELGVRPPLMVPANGMEGKIRTSPGAIITVRAGTRDWPKPLDTGSDPRIAEHALDRRIKSIERAFMADKLRLPEIDRMTKEEVITRRQMGLIVMSPVLGRLYIEMLNRSVNAQYQRLKKSNKIPMPPKKYAGITLGVAYMGPMAGSRSSSQVDAFERMLAAVLPMAEHDPTILQGIDTNDLVRNVARHLMLDPRFLRTRKAMRQIQEKQQEMASAASVADVANTASSAVKNLATAGGARAA